MTTHPTNNGQPARSGRAADEQTPDQELLDRVRAGDVAAFGCLYERHVDPATGFARSLTRCADDAADLVADAFARVFDLLLRERGPVSAFRPYLFCTLKNLATDNHRREQRLELCDELDGTLDREPGEVLLSKLDEEAVRFAFASLPPQWAEILWQIEIESIPPRHLVDDLETTAHNLSALAHRAREGLRDAYLSESNRHNRPGCEGIVQRLGAHVRGNVGLRERRRIDQHLDACDMCATSMRHVRSQVPDSGLPGASDVQKEAG